MSAICAWTCVTSSKTRVFAGRFYVVERSGEPMAVILGLDAYHSLVHAAQAAIDDIPDDLNPAR